MCLVPYTPFPGNHACPSWDVPIPSPLPLVLQMFYSWLAPLTYLPSWRTPSSRPIPCFCPLELVPPLFFPQTPPWDLWYSNLLSFLTCPTPSSHCAGIPLEPLPRCPSPWVPFLAPWEEDRDRLEEPCTPCRLPLVVS